MLGIPDLVGDETDTRSQASLHEPMPRCQFGQENNCRIAGCIVRMPVCILEKFDGVQVTPLVLPRDRSADHLIDRGPVVENETPLCHRGYARDNHDVSAEEELR